MKKSRSRLTLIKSVSAIPCLEMFFYPHKGWYWKDTCLNHQWTKFWAPESSSRIPYPCRDLFFLSIIAPLRLAFSFDFNGSQNRGLIHSGLVLMEGYALNDWSCKALRLTLWACFLRKAVVGVIVEVYFYIFWKSTRAKVTLESGIDNAHACTYLWHWYLAYFWHHSTPMISPPRPYSQFLEMF